MSKPITQIYQINASPQKVFEALTNAKIIQEWSGAPAKMDAQAGTEFSLFGDSIVGKNVEVVPNEILVQDWAEATWESPSRVTFTLTAAKGGTTVELRHENVPEASLQSISQGWQQFYLGQIQKMFGGD